MIKQSSTYYDDLVIKTYTEYLNDVETIYKEFDTKGNITYVRKPNYWQRVIYNDINLPIYKMMSNGNHWYRDYEPNGKVRSVDNYKTCYDNLNGLEEPPF